MKSLPHLWLACEVVIFHSIFHVWYSGIVRAMKLMDHLLKLSNIVWPLLNHVTGDKGYVLSI